MELGSVLFCMGIYFLEDMSQYFRNFRLCRKYTRVCDFQTHPVCLHIYMKCPVLHNTCETCLATQNTCNDKIVTTGRYSIGVNFKNEATNGCRFVN